MDTSRSVLLFFVGAILASAFFLFGFDRFFVPHWLRHAEAVSLAIVPSQASSAATCPESYAVDNRTDHLVLLTLASPPGGYAPPPPPPSDDSSRTSSKDYGYGVADLTGLDDILADSSEPRVHSTAESYPDDSNYGGSSPSYGSDTSSGSAQGSNGGYSYSDPGYDQTSGGYSQGGMVGSFADNQSNGYGYQSGGSYSSGAGNIPPPPSGQSVPLTPPANSSPYGAPVTPGYGYSNGYGGGGYGNSGYGYSNGGYGNSGYSNSGYGNGYGYNGYNYGPPPIEVRPGEIYFASNPAPSGQDGQAPSCDPSSNTVTVQLSN